MCAKSSRKAPGQRDPGTFAGVLMKTDRLFSYSHLSHAFTLSFQHGCFVRLCTPPDSSLPFSLPLDHGSSASISSNSSSPPLNEWKIYCDLDGVLSDFDKRAREVCRRNIDQITPQQMWADLASSQNFFSTLPWMKDGPMLWEFLSSLASPSQQDAQIKVSLFILTGLPGGRYGKTAKRQKKAWCSKHLGLSTDKVITCKSSEKSSYCKGKQCILIDDRVRNGEQWVETGGQFVFHTSAAKSIFLVKKILFPSSYNRELLEASESLLQNVSSRPLSSPSPFSSPSFELEGILGGEVIFLNSRTLPEVMKQALEDLSVGDLDFGSQRRQVLDEEEEKEEKDGGDETKEMEEDEEDEDEDEEDEDEDEEDEDEDEDEDEEDEGDEEQEGKEEEERKEKEQEQEGSKLDGSVQGEEQGQQQSKEGTKERKVFCIDVEWRPDETILKVAPHHKSRGALLQIAFTRKSDETSRKICYVIDLLDLHPSLEEALFSLLQHPGALKISFGFIEDAPRLLSALCSLRQGSQSLCISPSLDMQTSIPMICGILGGKEGERISLGRCCTNILGCELPLKSKEMQLSDWEKRPLSSRQIQYAAQVFFFSFSLSLFHLFY